MAKHSTPMTRPAAVRIQSHADRTGTNAGFKARAMSAAATQPASPPARPAAPAKK